MLKPSSGIIIFLLFINLSAQKSLSVKDLERSGSQSFTRGDFDAAIAEFTRVIELNSRLETKGRAHRTEFAKPPPAVEEALARDAIRVIDPRTAVAYVNRGRAYFAKGEIDKAMEDFNQAILISPQMYDGYFFREPPGCMKRSMPRHWPTLSGRSGSARGGSEARPGRL